MNKNQNLARHSSKQESRFLPALEEGYAKVDDRSLEDFLLFTYGLSKLIHFYNLENQIEGDWSDFLDDEVVILARISEINPQAIEVKFKTYLSKIEHFRRPAKKLTYLKKCFDEIFQVARLIDSWLVKFRDIERFVNVQLEARNEIINTINNQLSPDFILLDVMARECQKKENLNFDLGLDFSIFNSSWNLGQDDRPPYVFEGLSLSDQLENLSYDLQKIFQNFYETLIYLKQKALFFLQRSYQSDQHYPEVALLLSFLKLYQIPQKNLNQLPRRYLDFYYEKVLQQKPKPPILDQTYLSFDINDNALFATIEEGEAFVGGEYANGDNIIYQVDQSTYINRAKVAKLYSVFKEYESFIVQGRQKELVHNLLSAEIPLEEVRPSPNQQFQALFPTFGESQTNKTQHEKTMTSARLGFVIASPALFLSEGKREITIQLEFTEDSFIFLKQFLNDLSIINEDTVQQIFVKSFLEALLIDVSTADGWFRVDKYVVNLEKDDRHEKLPNSLVISFDLETSDPALLPYDQNIHGGNYQSRLPLIRFQLNSESYIYTYSLLESLILEKVIIHTDVSEIKDLALYSDIGPLSPDNPFYPFGSVPNIGSYLIIGKNEIFQKSLNKLLINLEWFNLPRDSDGFQGYYHSYDSEIDNHSFEVKLSILDGGIWKPQRKEEQQSFTLFRSTLPSLTQNGNGNGNGKTPEDSDLEASDEPSEHPENGNGSSHGTAESALGQSDPKGILNDSSCLEEIDMAKIKLPPNYEEINAPLEYRNTSQRGFIKLELNAPSFAFGNTIYPAVLSEIVMENSRNNLMDNVRRGFSKKENKKLPNPPYIPQIKSISLSYSSTSAISFSDSSKKTEKEHHRGQFYHLHPFGENLIYPDSAQQTPPLLSKIDYQGALFIGLKELKAPQEVSILFELKDGFGISSEEKPPVIEWSYLVNNRWKTLPESKILRDETSRFRKTGIITLELPFEIKNGNSILDPSLYWLRVSVIQNIEGTSKLASLCTQVLTVTLANLDAEGLHLQKALPAFTISRSLNNIPGIQRVTQPLPSFRGRPAEDQQSYYIRTGERIRHQQRAITAWDFEHLILERFPNIHKVTCLPNMSSKKLEDRGRVLIVVTPFKKPDQEYDLEPKVNSEQLSEIKKYLKSYTSAFGNIEIRNPSYERVRIVCAVKLALGHNYGFFVQKLNDDINQYLIGDMIKSSKTLELGGKINTSDVLSYLRTLPYVDFITKFSMVQIAKDHQGQYQLLDTARENDSKSFLEATKPWSALIPDQRHQIEILNEKEEIKSEQMGISGLELGNNFIIDE